MIPRRRSREEKIPDIEHRDDEYEENNSKSHSATLYAVYREHSVRPVGRERLAQSGRANSGWLR